MSMLKVNSIIPDGFGNGVLLKSTKNTDGQNCKCSMVQCSKT